MEQLEKFVVEFFRNLKCQVRWESQVSGVRCQVSGGQEEDVLVVENVPKSFEDLFGKASPYNLMFSNYGSGQSVVGSRELIFVGKGSALLAAITKFLEGAGKTTLLKIDFDCDAEAEIAKAISLKNCEVSNLVKKHRNSFFSRFTFMTTFRYLNESEQIVNEIYVHNGEVVDGDLSGYTVVEGDSKLASSQHVEVDYKVARDYLKDSLMGKTKDISEILGTKADVEIERIKDHYESLLSELGGDLTGQLEKVKETELALRSCEEKDREILRGRLGRLRKGLIKVGDDEARTRILKEQEFTIKDAMHKHSLGVDNKLVNTTVIYYPIFNFNLFLRGNRNAGRYIEMSYDPLTKSLNEVNCEGCKVKISDLNLCGSGHICCEDCLRKCGECGGQFCVKCLTRSCSVCGKALCKECAKMCIGCGKNVCVNHMRMDCVTGDERCVLCLRACMRCHGLSNARYFGEALDGSKVCSKCLGAERREGVMKKVFRE